jgi:hypothetical protein
VLLSSYFPQHSTTYRQESTVIKSSTINTASTRRTNARNDVYSTSWLSDSQLSDRTSHRSLGAYSLLLLDIRFPRTQPHSPIVRDVFKSNAAQISNLAIENEPELKSRADSWECKLPRSISGLSWRESPSSRIPHLRQPSPGPKNSYQEERLEETGCSEGTRGGRDPYKV